MARRRHSLVAANMVNIVLDLLSVLVFDFGLAGVVWATVIAFAVNSLILLVLLCRTTDRIRLERHHMRFSREELHHIIRIGLPAGIQGMVFALSNVLIQSALNSLGTEAMAASAAAFIIEGNIYCFVNGFSQATTTFVGQKRVATRAAASASPKSPLASKRRSSWSSPCRSSSFRRNSSACSTATRTSSPWGRSASFT